MKKYLKKILGFRSWTPWKMIVACLYAVVALVYLWFAMTTPLPIEAGTYDTVIYRISAFVIFLWIISPVIFLSDTPLRRHLPLFRKKVGSMSLVGMMVVFLLFSYLFAMTESWHTPEYKEAFEAYNEAAYEQFVEAGGG